MEYRRREKFNFMTNTWNAEETKRYFTSNMWNAEEEKEERYFMSNTWSAKEEKHRMTKHKECRRSREIFHDEHLEVQKKMKRDIP